MSYIFNWLLEPPNHRLPATDGVDGTIKH